MGRSGISYHDVSKTIATLQGQQKNPTVDNIRSVLGTGSKSTIARFLREWKAEQGLSSTDPASIPSELLALVKGLWERLQTKSATQVTDYQRESDAKVSEAEQQVHQAAQRQRELEATIHRQEEQLAQQGQDNQQLQNTLNLEHQEKIKLAAQASAMETHRQTSLTENERLHQLLKQVEQNLAHYQQSTQTLRQEQTLRFEKQQHAHQQAQAQLQKQLEIASGQKLHFQSEYTQMNKTRQALEKEHKALVLTHHNTQKQMDFLKITNQNLQEKYDQLFAQRQQQSEGFAGKEHTLIELTIQLKTAQEKIVSLSSLLAKAEDKVIALRSDYQFSAQKNANLTGQISQLEAMLSKKTVAIARG